MVYCGKPSKGCSNCRERKIRCDQKDPGCGQCTKRQIECPGYRNIVDLMFRDESNHVIKKATTAKPRIKKLKHGVRAAPKLDAAPLPLNPPPPSPSAGVLVLRDSPRPSKALGPFKTHSKNGPLLSVLLAGSRGDGDRYDNDSWQTNSYPYEYERIVRRGHSDDDDDDDGDDSFDFDDETDTLVHIPYAPSHSLQERGTAFFFSRYVATDHGCYQNYDFIYDIWKPPSMSRAGGWACLRSRGQMLSSLPA
ncbi:hypothetical protein TrVFT333_005852 [Trichoderma virens FT-333]|nr:hypothetical protein TrVFT333_005852 [Trichoderma virens FT-333]